MINFNRLSNKQMLIRYLNLHLRKNDLNKRLYHFKFYIMLNDLIYFHKNSNL